MLVSAQLMLVKFADQHSQAAHKQNISNFADDQESLVG